MRISKVISFVLLHVSFNNLLTNPTLLLQVKIQTGNKNNPENYLAQAIIQSFRFKHQPLCRPLSRKSHRSCLLEPVNSLRQLECFYLLFEYYIPTTCELIPFTFQKLNNTACKSLQYSPFTILTRVTSCACMFRVPGHSTCWAHIVYTNTQIYVVHIVYSLNNVQSDDQTVDHSINYVSVLYIPEMVEFNF